MINRGVILLSLLFLLLIGLIGCNNDQITLKEQEQVYISARTAIAKSSDLINWEWRKNSDQRDINHIMNVLSSYFTGESLENINNFLNSLPPDANDVASYKELLNQYYLTIPFGPLVGEIKHTRFQSNNPNIIHLDIHINVSEVLGREYVLLNDEKVFQMDYNIDMEKQNGVWKISKYLFQTNKNE